MAISTVDEAIQWIHGRLQFGSRPGLERVIYLLNELDNPHKKLKCIHFAGTNGKGSTLTFSRMLFQSAGLKVGSFTSPYITHFNERICIEGIPLSDTDLINLTQRMIPIVEKMDQIDTVQHITEFELLTAMMLLYFVEQKVDIALIEVGLGGLLDSTNVIMPLVSVITTIGLDHTEILGETIQLIAAQKGGIIKENTPVVVGNVPHEAMDEIKQIADNHHSTLYQFNSNYGEVYNDTSDKKIESFDFWSDNHSVHHVQINLIGRHQTENACVALETFYIASEILHLSLPSKEIKLALASARWPGRLEVISTDPLIILDGAHNSHGISSLVSTVNKRFSQNDIYIIFSAISSKDITSMVQLLQTIPNVRIFVTTFHYPKALSREDYERLVPGIEFISSWEEALSLVLHTMSEEDSIFITGSLYFISEVRNELLGTPNEGGL